jgi:1,4-dihydroxy-2-naphthoate octaprenyltransferase
MVRHDAIAWTMLPLVVLCSLLVHAGTNYISDAGDYLHGVDRVGTKGGSGLVVDGTFTAPQVHRAGLVCFAAAALLAVPLVLLRGTPLLVLGAVGLLGGYLYSVPFGRGGAPKGYKHVALGDIAVFALMGPLMVIGAHVALTGVLVTDAAFVAFPVGCLVTAILAGNNLRDIDNDLVAGTRTLAGLLGHTGAARWYAALVVGAFASLPVLAALHLLPWTSLLAFATAPLAAKNVRAALASRPNDGTLDVIDMHSAQLHLGFGVLLTVGAVVGALL